MRATPKLLAAAVWACLALPSWAATTIYTTPASFAAQVNAGAYTESFTGLANHAGPAAAAFSGSGFSYIASAADGLYLAGGFLGANQINQALTINFTSGNVTAVGANFFSTNIADDFQAVSVTVTLGDGTTTTFTPATLGDSFRGFTSTSPIASLVISAPGQSLYAGLDGMTVGVASVVPEMGTASLMGLGLMAGLVAARRRRS